MRQWWRRYRDNRRAQKMADAFQTGYLTALGSYLFHNATLEELEQKSDGAFNQNVYDTKFDEGVWCAVDMIRQHGVLPSRRKF